MINQRKVYLYKWAGEKEFIGIALDCHMHQRTGEDWKELWFDATGRGHMIKGEIARETQDGFVFRSDGFKPGEWIFKELTIEDFRRKYCKLVGAGEAIAAKINTTEDLHEWFRKQFGE